MMKAPRQAKRVLLFLAVVVCIDMFRVGGTGIVGSLHLVASVMLFDRLLYSRRGNPYRDQSIRWLSSDPWSRCIAHAGNFWSSLVILDARPWTSFGSVWVLCCDFDRLFSKRSVSVDVI